MTISQTQASAHAVQAFITRVSQGRAGVPERRAIERHLGPLPESIARTIDRGIGTVRTAAELRRIAQTRLS